MQSSPIFNPRLGILLPASILSRGMLNGRNLTATNQPSICSTIFGNAHRSLEAPRRSFFSMQGPFCKKEEDCSIRTESKPLELLSIDLNKIDWRDSISLRKIFKGNFDAYKKAFIYALEEDDAVMQISLVIAYWEARWDKDHLKEHSLTSDAKYKKFLSLTEWKYNAYINLYKECFPAQVFKVDDKKFRQLEEKAKKTYDQAAELRFPPAKVFNILNRISSYRDCWARSIELKKMPGIEELAVQGDREAQFYYGKALFEESHTTDEQEKKGLLLMFQSGYLEIHTMKKFLGEYRWQAYDDGISEIFHHRGAVFFGRGRLACPGGWIEKNLVIGE